MVLDPRSVRRFLVVCEEGSIGAAARRLHITQPAVSTTINKLEEALGITLFTRSRTGITLTSVGISLQRRAKAMEALLEQAEREIKLVQIDAVGPLVIGGTPGALASLVPRAVAIIKEVYPAFELRIIEATDRELSEMLRSGQIELAVVTTGATSQGDDLVEEAVLGDPFSLIVGRKNDHLPDRIALSKLTDARWILPNVAGAFRRQVNALFVTTNTPLPNDVIRCDSLLTTKAIVRETDYLTILPRDVVLADLEAGSLRAIPIKGSVLRYVGIRMLADHDLSNFAQAFVDALRGLEKE